MTRRRRSDYGQPHRYPTDRQSLHAQVADLRARLQAIQRCVDRHCCLCAACLHEVNAYAWHGDGLARHA